VLSSCSSSLFTRFNTSPLRPLAVPRHVPDCFESPTMIVGFCVRLPSCFGTMFLREPSQTDIRTCPFCRRSRVRCGRRVLVSATHCSPPLPPPHALSFVLPQSRQCDLPRRRKSPPLFSLPRPSRSWVPDFPSAVIGGLRFPWRFLSARLR